MPAIVDCQLEFSAESQNGNHSDANETRPLFEVSNIATML